MEVSVSQLQVFFSLLAQHDLYAESGMQIRRARERKSANCEEGSYEKEIGRFEHTRARSWTQYTN